MSKALRALAPLVLLALTLAGAGCARRVRVETATVAAPAAPQYFQPAPTNVLIAQPQPLPIVRAAVIRALADLGYSVAGEDGQRIVAAYRRGHETVQIQVEYWPTQATISYLSSSGLRFRGDGTSPSYERWMANLQRNIPAQVAALARQSPQVIVVTPVQPAPPATATVVVQPAPAPPPAAVVVQPAPPSSGVVIQEVPAARLEATVVIH